MRFGWINAVNAVFVLVLIITSVIGQKKSGLAPMQSKHTLLNILEQVGRYACMALLILPLLPGLEFGFPSSTAMVMWLILPPLLLVCYAILWTQTKRGSWVLYGLAIVPAVLFFCCGLLLRHWALVAAALLFGVSHALIVRETTKKGRDAVSVTIRPIEPRDNAGVEQLIRTCLIEFDANHAGTAWADPDLDRYAEVYNQPQTRYWVAEDSGAIVGGVGIGPLPGADGVCELQKMYCLPPWRGTGVAHRLMEEALAFAARHYKQCYLETLSNMVAAQKFYEKYGFRRVQSPPVPTAHFACDVRYLLDLPYGEVPAP